MQLDVGSEPTVVIHISEMHFKITLSCLLPTIILYFSRYELLSSLIFVRQTDRQKAMHMSPGDHAKCTGGLIYM